MSLPHSWIPRLEELGTAVKGAAYLVEAEGGEQGRAAGKAAVAVIRATNAKLAALEEECRKFQRLYEDLSKGVRRYAEAQMEEAAAARRADEEHREEMQSMVAAMAILRKELERAAKDSAAVRAAAAEASTEARVKAEAAEKYRQQYEAELQRRQELEMANIKMAREALAVPEKLRAFERECASLKQTVAVLEEKCRLKEATFVDADDRAAKLQSELLEWRKKGLALELKLKEETEEKLVVQRLLELERSRKVARDGNVRRELSPVAAAVGRLTTTSERQKAPGNKQPFSHPGLTSEHSAGKLRGAFDANRPPFKPSGNPTSPTKTGPPSKSNPDYHFPAAAEPSLKSRADKIGPISAVPDKGPRSDLENAPLTDENRPGDPPGALQREVERAVMEALRAAEERCDRAVAAAEARGKQALAQAELDRERAVRVATMDLEARLRKEFAGEKRAIAETAAAEAMEAAVVAAVEEQESLHRQIDQLQAAVRRYKSGVRSESEPVRTASGSKAHVAAARRQAVLKRVPLMVRKDGRTGVGNGTEGGSVSGAEKRTETEMQSRGTGQNPRVVVTEVFRKGSSGEEPVKQGARPRREELFQRSDSLANENERLRKALDKCVAGRLVRDIGQTVQATNGDATLSPRGMAYVQSDDDTWDSDGELSGRFLRAEASDTVVSGAGTGARAARRGREIEQSPSLGEGDQTGRDQGSAGRGKKGNGEGAISPAERSPVRNTCRVSRGLALSTTFPAVKIQEASF
ncbi:hypothetical protein KFL_007400050 [Klebsormidium nitens]|uniref:Uncharacterized protein n=1 Tax=Klebsormidium nitens TaxID=105231 RepID=A0A1Y1INX3_KLENI|nr:hypothetical protein KFL_007400050 [Klebsormidium nitens]|eukprot:GAQ91189.1 hypothetical protein KFL_007400050 [Klebsormidium nitens]